MRKIIVGFSKDLTTAVAALTLVFSGLYWLAEPRIAEYIKSHLETSAENGAPSSGGPCANIPRNGHIIEGNVPGGFGTVEWRDVERLRDDCGIPLVTGVLTNGGGFYHDSETTTNGILLTKGIYTLKYGFKISEEARPGHARFRVVVTYPDAIGGAPPAISPWLSFDIDPPVERNLNRTEELSLQ